MVSNDMVWFGYLLYPFFLPPGSYHSQNSSSKYSLEDKGSMAKSVQSENLRNIKLFKICNWQKGKIILGLLVAFLYAKLNKEKERKGVYMKEKSPFF